MTVSIGQSASDPNKNLLKNNDALKRQTGLMRLSNRLKKINLISDAVMRKKSSKIGHLPTLLSFQFFPYFFG
jgi:hypothetical protein